MESRTGSLTASDSALQDQVAQLTQRVGGLGDEVTRMLQEGEREVEDVLFNEDALQVRDYSTSSPLYGVLICLMAACE